jgi:D-alanyl-D-alanine dipeptidase
MSNDHPEFVSLEEVCKKLIIRLDYSTELNFTGQIVPGYHVKKALLAKTPAIALARVQEKALAQGFSLKIFDSYRPVKAVKFFQDWAKLPENNPYLKSKYYPKYQRLDLFELGFIAKQSSHSRGCAVDLTLVDIETLLDLDMGSEFDYFDEVSHTESGLISPLQLENRMRLKHLMESEGFRNFYQEWWHFSYRPEPFPDQSFDFDIR